jgi:hypothetical protein
MPATKIYVDTVTITEVLTRGVVIKLTVVENAANEFRNEKSLSGN